MSSALNRSEFIHSRGAFRAELSRVYIYTCQEGIRYVCINRHHFNTLLNYLYCRDLGKKSREIIQELGCCSLSLSITPCYYFVCIWHLWSIRVLNFKILLNLWKTTNQRPVFLSDDFFPSSYCTWNTNDPRGTFCSSRMIFRL